MTSRCGRDGEGWKVRLFGRRKVKVKVGGVCLAKSYLASNEASKVGRSGQIDPKGRLFCEGRRHIMFFSFKSHTLLTVTDSTSVHPSRGNYIHYPLIPWKVQDSGVNITHYTLR